MVPLLSFVRLFAPRCTCASLGANWTPGEARTTERAFENWEAIRTRLSCECSLSVVRLIPVHQLDRLVICEDFLQTQHWVDAILASAGDRRLPLNITTTGTDR